MSEPEYDEARDHAAPRPEPPHVPPLEEHPDLMALAADPRLLEALDDPAAARTVRDRFVRAQGRRVFWCAMVLAAMDMAGTVAALPLLAVLPWPVALPLAMLLAVDALVLAGGLLGCVLLMVRGRSPVPPPPGRRIADRPGYRELSEREYQVFDVAAIGFLVAVITVKAVGVTVLLAGAVGLWWAVAVALVWAAARRLLPPLLRRVTGDLTAVLPPRATGT
jgi:MFS family permease